MPALSFMPWKAKKVESGECRQTIRKPRKRPIKVGDRLYLWQEQRRPWRRKLGETDCTELLPFVISGFPWSFWYLNGNYLSEDEMVGLAKADGFETWRDLWYFLRDHYGLPFEGVVIRWEELDR